MRIMRGMNAVEHIRRNVLGLSQEAFSKVAGVSQPTVSRWERGELEPGRDEMSLIRSKAIELGKAWDDSWFFEVPQGEPERAA